MLEAPPAATLSPQPQQHDVFAQQYAFPNTYSVARGNNSTSSQSGSPSSPSSPSYSYSSAEAAGNNTMGAYPFNPALSAVYDPSTGIVYYPHLPPGAVAVPVGGGMPTRLVPLGQSSEASVPVQAAYGRSDGSRTPEFSLVDDGAAGGGGGGGSCSGGGGRPAVVRKLSGSKAIYDSNISATIMHGSVGAQVKKDKKDKNRGSYRCGRCGKPKVIAPPHSVLRRRC